MDGATKFLLSVLFLTLSFSGFVFSQNYISDIEKENRWVDSVYNSLETNERIAQLMLVRANQPDQEYDARIAEYIKKYNIGGVTFFRGKPEKQLLQTNRWQQLSKTPLFVSIDAEWGLSMRLTGTVSYPLQMTLGAVENDNLIYEMGRQIAEQCKRLGIHINFAPVVDVNNNPVNPVIGMRSFGDTPEIVSRKGIAYANGLKAGGVIATAKHFPGHGDTKNDSHYTLPVILHSRSHLDSTELYPFRKIIENGVDGIMIAHLDIPSLDEKTNTPSTLSEKVVTDLLKNQMGFNGLIVTDGLDMKGVTSVHPPGTIELLALKAGNDILLLPENVPLAIEMIKSAIEKGDLPESRLEESCRKVLRYKYRAGLNTYRPMFTEQLTSDLNKDEYKKLAEKLIAEAITIVKNEDEFIPLQKDNVKWALLTVGSDKTSAMHVILSDAGLKSTPFQLNKGATKEQISALQNQLKSFDKIIVNIQNTNIVPGKKFGIEDAAILFINELSKSKPLILNVFASPYALDFFNLNENYKAVVIGYQDRQDAYRAVSDILLGKKQASGKLPVTLKSGFSAGHGITAMKNILEILPDEIKLPETAVLPVLNETFLKKIDSTALSGIQKKAYPGCQIVALLDGHVVYNKAFGHLTYDNDNPVTDTTIYDLASLTKVLASTLAIMKLYEDSLISLEANLGSFFPYLKKTDKADIRLIDILTHQSGFDGWIAYYLKTLDKDGFDPKIYSTSMSPEFPLRVAKDLYINRTYKHMLFDEIASSKLKTKEYRYSDLGFYFVPDIVSLITNEEFDVYLKKQFYDPLGLKHLTFRPLFNFPEAQIAPTENDKDFRKQLLRGTVHDQGAALMGGISGHAGLFGNAMDVAKLLQMLVNKGSLNGIQFLKPETVSHFNTAHFANKKNRRGIGFDKPPLTKKENGWSMSDSASMQCFGHTGFTGTFAYADPANNLVVVFLSNRVYPDASVNLLAKLNIRTTIHSFFYQALKHSTAMK
jgi:beta-N-acetylhexosaminidase